MASSDDPTQNQQVAGISLSLPELLTLLFLEKRDLAPQIQGYVIRDSPLLAPATVLALILDLGLQKLITLKLKSTWIRGERMVINLADARGTSTQNEVLDLMIDRLKNQKHDHSVQQWADHWCGKTFRELLFPTHPTEELRRVVLNKLATRGMISWKTISNGELIPYTPSSSPIGSVQPIIHLEIEGQAVVNQVRQLLTNLLKAESDNNGPAFDSTQYSENMNHIDIRLLLMSSLCPADIVEMIQPDPQQNAACRKSLDGMVAKLIGDHGQDSKSIVSEDIKTILHDIRNYLVSVKLLQ